MSVADITFEIDGNLENVVIAELLNEGFRDELRERIEQAETQVCVHVNSMLNLSDEDRFHFIDFMCECESSLTFIRRPPKQFLVRPCERSHGSYSCTREKEYPPTMVGLRANLKSQSAAHPGE